MTAQPFFVPSLLISFLAIPLVLGMMPPNRWYGVRTPQTLADERTWYRSNRFAGCAFLLSGAIYFAVAAAFPTAGRYGSDFALLGLHLCAFALPLAASVMLTVRHVKALMQPL